VTEILDLTIERPVAGGLMLARHDGRIVFVSGAIPGERVRARVERKTKQVWWAAVTEIIEASGDRRDSPFDPACGGSTFAHIRYDRQRELKQQILVDAFRRLAHVMLDAPPAVAASPEQGYRLRARLHVSQGRVGYYLEGTHTICDAAATSQLLPASTDAAAAVFAALGARASDCAAVVVSENITATQRVIHLEPREGARLDDAMLEGLSLDGVPSLSVAGAPAPGLPPAGAPGLQTRGIAGVTGVTTLVRGKLRTIVGSDALFGGASPLPGPAEWTRRAPAFFQGNRFLVGSLVRHVLDASPGDRVVDLYAGVGLFSVALAARGAQVVAVEGEAFAAADLAINVAPWGARVLVDRADVEDAVRRTPASPPEVVVLDPPRTGVSPEALTGLIAWRAPRLVYVSCDPPTLARDAARLLTNGYRLESLDGFDMFPNTPHVEAVAVFTRAVATA
jgi:tRNA/tmRNA/rRNA uracil-C5-methylase (TrmA/RlmC/RlmD family)